ncbi:hypothetical protein AGDE_05056 [Angomonas deanei]|uniref:Choline transporter-like protein n=1 Tax=Angomonas deanei TaxID=59799 RepID=A0A7G2C435_9TRYP|nr:hypothetical protein AGDE_05056 [Angomonas deanei]CAD2214359.1 Plasma-membrane choline transporter, putative [Angomonas deanei]|eukprot:EPY38873.1 hypothetical protein AGDE_05056 [Angomonas deanei]
MNVVLTVVSAILSFVAGNNVGGILLLVCAALNALWLFLVRSRIPFSAELLRVAAKVVFKFKMLIVLNFVAIVFSIGFFIFWVSAIFPMTDRATTNKAVPVDGFLFFLLALSLFWTTQVSMNVCHTTTAGVTATWYFVGDTKHNQTVGAIEGETANHRLPKYATLKALKRSLTTSFGSICFGSLLVAIVQLLRFIAESSNNNDDSAGGNLLRCCAICILRCLENIIQYFNNYAFVHVAIYGTTYIQSAKKTFALFHHSFWQLYINDLLIDPTLSMTALTLSIIMAVIVGLALQNIVFGVFSFLLNLYVLMVFFMPIGSAVTTLFVCFAEMPEGLRACDEKLYQSFLEKDGGSSIIPREQN